MASCYSNMTLHSFSPAVFDQFSFLPFSHQPSFVLKCLTTAADLPSLVWEDRLQNCHACNISFYHKHLVQWDCHQGALHPHPRTHVVMYNTVSKLKIPVVKIPSLSLYYGHLEAPFAFRSFWVLQHHLQNHSHPSIMTDQKQESLESPLNQFSHSTFCHHLSVLLDNP